LARLIRRVSGRQGGVGTDWRGACSDGTGLIAVYCIVRIVVRLVLDRRMFARSKRMPARPGTTRH